MNTIDNDLLETFVKEAKSLFDRGYVTGSAGNMSALLSDGSVVATPSGSSFGNLDINKLSIVDIDGNIISGPKPTKEIKFHLEIYKNNKSSKAVVHLHSTYCTALSCIENLPKDNVLKAFTPYVVMKMGEIPLINYYKPGSELIAQDIATLAHNHKAFLLANHGPITTGSSIKSAINNMEEFESTAKVFFILKSANVPIKYLTDNELKELL